MRPWRSGSATDRSNGSGCTDAGRTSRLSASSMTIVEEGIIDLLYGEGPCPVADGCRRPGGSTGAVLRGTESLLTHRWREMDSNLYGAFPVKWCFSVYYRDTSMAKTAPARP